MGFSGGIRKTKLLLNFYVNRDIIFVAKAKSIIVQEEFLMKKFVNALKQLSPFGKLCIVAIPIAIILFSLVCCNTNWDEFCTTEQDYIALEEVAHEIIDTKDIVQPLEGNLKHYEAEFTDDGTIKIVLYGTAESVHLTLTDDYEVKSLYRGISTDFLEVVVVLLICVLAGLVSAMIIYDAAGGIKRIYYFFKN